MRRVWLDEAEEQRLLLRLLERGPVAALPRRAHAPASSARATGSTTARSTSASPTPSARRSTRDDPIVLVQDYHFALAPRMIRERLPRATIITFWHIPWPNAERIGICPWREELHRRPARLEHRRLPHAAALQQLHRLGRRASSSRGSIASTTPSSSGGRRDAGPALPDLDRVAGALARAVPPRSPTAGAAMLRASSGCRRRALLGVGVDRLDYTKGIEERLARRRAAARARARTCAGASPSCSSPRRAAPRSTATASCTIAVEALAERINERFGAARLPPDHPAPRAPRAAGRLPLLSAPPTSAT